MLAHGDPSERLKRCKDTDTTRKPLNFVPAGDGSPLHLLSKSRSITLVDPRKQVFFQRPSFSVGNIDKDGTTEPQVSILKTPRHKPITRWKTSWIDYKEVDNAPKKKTVPKAGLRQGIQLSTRTPLHFIPLETAKKSYLSKSKKTLKSVSYFITTNEISSLLRSLIFSSVIPPIPVENLPRIPATFSLCKEPSDDALRSSKRDKFSSPIPSSPSGPMPPTTVHPSPCPIPIRSAQQVNLPVSLVPFAPKNTFQQPPSSPDQPQNVDLAISKTLLKTSLKSLGSFLGSFRETARLATQLQGSVCTDTSPKRKRNSSTRRRKVSSPNTEITALIPSRMDRGSLHVLSQLQPIKPTLPQPKRHVTNLPSRSTTKPGPTLLRSFTASSRSLLDSARSLTQLPAAPVFTSQKKTRDRMHPATPINNKRIPKENTNLSGAGVSLTGHSKPSSHTVRSSAIQKNNSTTSPGSRLMILAALRPHSNTVILSSSPTQMNNPVSELPIYVSDDPFR